jgi:hypothetical protein
VEEVDALTGPLIGLPKSASFRLIDIVGLDVWVHVLRNLYEAVPGDPARELYRIPEIMRQMMERGWLGEKRGQGFYKRVGKGESKEIRALDRKTLEYRPMQKVKFAAVEAVRGIEDLGERLRALIAGSEAPSQFLWQLFRDFVLYSAHMVPEISDPHRGTRSRDALGLRLRARTLRVVGRAGSAGDGGANARRWLRDSRQRRAHAGERRAEFLPECRCGGRTGHALLRS